MVFDKIIMMSAISLIMLVAGLLFKGFDRKLAARMQARVGPPIIQPFRDVKKLLLKENIVPDTAIGWLFNLMPLIALGSTLTIFFYVPIGSISPILSEHGDLILILYLLIIPAIALVIGGFSSGSPYAVVGAQREMVMMMSYEFPLATAAIAIAWKMSTQSSMAEAFSLTAIASTPVWGLVGPIGFVGCIILLLVLLLIIPAELSKVPFDAPEAETEIAAGLLTEYSGRNLMLFYLTDATKTMALAAIVVALFFPYNISTILGLSDLMAVLSDACFFFAKVFLLIFLGVTFIRVAVPRLKITQIVEVYWVILTLISFLGLFLVMFDSVIGGI